MRSLYLFKLYFNIILSSTRRIQKLLLPSKFSDKNITPIFLPMRVARPLKFSHTQKRTLAAAAAAAGGGGDVKQRCGYFGSL
jgi:hypothetical protein